MPLMSSFTSREKKAELLTPFLAELESIAPLEAPVRDILIEGAMIVHADKDQIIRHEGDTCQHLWVVLTGILRSYHFIGSTEVTSGFMKPCHMVIAIESFLSGTPAYDTLQAMQPSVLARISYTELNNLYRRFPSLNFIGRQLTGQYLYLTEKRLYMLRKQRARDRYLFFLEHYPGLVNEIPLRYIASFLGINSETLSRVRNGIR